MVKTLPPEQAVALIIQLSLPFQWNGCFEVFPPHKSVRATTCRHVLTEGMRDSVAKSAARGPLPGCIKISDEGVPCTGSCSEELMKAIGFEDAGEMLSLPETVAPKRIEAILQLILS